MSLPGEGEGNINSVDSGWQGQSAAMPRNPGGGRRRIDDSAPTPPSGRVSACSAAYSGIPLVVLLLLPHVGLRAQEPAPRRQAALYSVHFTVPERELVADLRGGPRGDPKAESSVAFDQWYSDRVKTRYGVWGPPARRYAAPEIVAGRSPGWLRERVIAVGLRFEGYGYQHHHVPDWDPPAGWPWKPTGTGHNGKGVDCSNFTAFVYNLALGMKPSADVKNQSKLTTFPGPGGSTVPVRSIPIPGSYDELVRILKTGDLLYIRSKEGEISHVVLWVGPIGRSPDGTPLVLDSHGSADVKDDRGAPIPPGVHLRPFRRNSWYFRSASHAIRVIEP